MLLTFLSMFVSYGNAQADNSSKGSDVVIKCEWQGKDEPTLIVTKHGEPQASPYHVVLTKKDEVELQLETDIQAKKLEIEYTITGFDVNAHFSKVAGEVFPASDEKAVGQRRKILAVTDDLLPGGLLTVTFKKTFADDSQDTASFKFRIQDEYPWFFNSFGMVFSSAKEPEVAIVNTNEIITFEKDGKTQQAHQQVIVLKDNDSQFEPIQSVVTFLNFRIHQAAYASLGFQVNEKIFTEPMLGVAFYRKIKNVGFAIHGGVHFSKELEILRASGFEDGQKVDPTIGLTVDDIPTQEKYHSRFFLGISARY
jgi:hypothetical protein